MKKRLFCLFLSILMLALVSCGDGEVTPPVETTDDTTLASDANGTDAPTGETTAPEESTSAPADEESEPSFTEPPVAPPAENYDGFSFDENGTCNVSRAYAKAPHTISVWLRLDQDFEERAGAILSNSDQSIKSCISLEIHKNGNPYFCYLDKTYVEHKFRFEDVDVRTGE